MKNLVAHILRKDFRHLWPWLALWWATFVLLALYPQWAFTRALFHGETVNSDLVYAIFIYIGCVVLSLLILSRLIESDSPLNDASLWRTLPLRPSRMLAAKLLFLVVFSVVLPTLIYLVAYLAYGLSWSEASTQLRGFVPVWTVVQLYLLAAGLFFRRAATGFAVLALLCLCVSILASFLAAQDSSSITLRAGFQFSSLLASAGVLAAVALIYLQQRRTWALFVLLLGFLLASLLDWIAPSPVKPASFLLPVPSVPSFALNLIPVTPVWETNEQTRDVSRYLLTTLPDDAFPGPGDRVWFPIVAHTSLTWTGNASAAPIPLAARPAPPEMNFAANPATGLPVHFAAALQAYGITHLVIPVRTARPNLGILSDATWEQLKTTFASLAGKINFAFGRLDVSARLPLVPRAVDHHGPVTTGIISVTPDPDTSSVSVFVALRYPEENDRRWYDSTDFCLLVNPRRGEAILGNTIGIYSNSVGLLNTERRRYVFNVQDLSPSHGIIAPDLLRAWLADAQFLQLHFTPLGNQAGTFAITDFRLQDHPPK